MCVCVHAGGKGRGVLRGGLGADRAGLDKKENLHSTQHIAELLANLSDYGAVHI